MPDTKFYDSNQVHVTYANRSLDSGRVEGEFVSTEYAVDTITPTVGADGEVTISRTNNKSGTIKLKLLQTSAGHRFLTQLWNTQQASPNGALAAFEIRDLTGSMLEHAPKTWIQKPPASGYGATAGEREWTLGCAELLREVT